MDDNSLGNYRSDLSRLEETEAPHEGPQEDQAAMYHQEINTLKIEKLSNRVTIISIIIPCLIIAILAFAYIDMKERVVDVGQTKGSQVEQLARTLEEKVNALDVRIAKAAFELEEKLPLMEKKAQALENQLAKISGAKADLKAFEAEVAKLEKRIKSNAGQDKATLAAIERINQELLDAIQKNNAQITSRSDRISQDMQLFKEEFDARLMELSAYEQQIGQLSKTTSLIDKQIKTLKKDTDAAVVYRLDQLRLALENRIAALEAQGTAAPAASAAPRKTTSSAPAPQIDPGPAKTPDTKTTDKGISQEPLTQ